MHIRDSIALDHLDQPKFCVMASHPHLGNEILTANDWSNPACPGFNTGVTTIGVGQDRPTTRGECKASVDYNSLIVYAVAGENEKSERFASGLSTRRYVVCKHA